jgi:hypothetical protein
MRVQLLAILAILLVTSAAYAQYGDQLKEIAESDEITIAEALWLVGSVSSSIGPRVAISDARSELEGLSPRLPSGADGEPVTLGQYSYLIVQFFDVQGGFWYGLLPGPLTALRVLQSLGITGESGHAGHPISGSQAVAILRQYLFQTDLSAGGRDE